MHYIEMQGYTMHKLECDYLYVNMSAPLVRSMPCLHSSMGLLC